ncbi:MAG TPA: L,D-transpeptidase [Anaerolineae bacterium]|nr:L,D-transpeptidase [Anaerolineae bacterium]
MKSVKFSVALLIGLVMLLAVASQVAIAQPSTTPEAAPAAQSGTVSKSSPSLTYAWVVTNNVQVYANPGDATPVRDLGAGFLYVSLADARPIVIGDQKWYQINSGEYVKATDIAIVRPSAFQGITLTATPDKPFGWMVYAVKPSAKAGDAPAKDAATINRYTPITVFEEAQVGDLTWYRIGDNQWVDQKKVALVFPTARPEGVGSTDKWVDVNKFEQTLAAYEGDKLVYATLVSSGLPQWDTDSGLFRIYMKVRQAKMSGREGKPDYYFLEDVPYAMYFNKDMALHGAYWHDKFGFKHSHGCVNLPPSAAEWLWNWTTPDATGKAFVMVADQKNNTEGTWVWVH